MSIDMTDIETIKTVIKPLLGKNAWNVSLGVGSFITMEFGNRVLTARGKTIGEWHLWIYCCGWYLENLNGKFLGSEDPRRILKQEIKILEERKLQDVTLSSIALETNFIFDEGLILHTFPLNFLDPVEYWMLFTPGKKVLVIGPARSWSYEYSSKENQEK